MITHAKVGGNLALVHHVTSALEAERLLESAIDKLAHDADLEPADDPLKVLGVPAAFR